MPCDANPCRNGATCLNTGQSFTCVCKEGFEGQHCQMEERQTPTSTATTSTSCKWSGRLYPDNSSWDDGCNKCQCRAGLAVCTRVWCGPANCLEDPINGGKACGPSEICLLSQTGCLRPPCPAYGQCRPLKPGRLLPVPAATASCWPNLAGNRLAPTCARLTLVLDRYNAQPGFSVQALCGHLRKMAAAQSHLWDNFSGQQQQLERPSLVILCDLKDNLDDVVQVTIVSRVYSILILFHNFNNFLSLTFNSRCRRRRLILEEAGQPQLPEYLAMSCRPTTKKDRRWEQ